MRDYTYVADIIQGIIKSTNILILILMFMKF